MIIAMQPDADIPSPFLSQTHAAEDYTWEIRLPVLVIRDRDAAFFWKTFTSFAHGYAARHPSGGTYIHYHVSRFTEGELLD